MTSNKLIFISTEQQQMSFFLNDLTVKVYRVSTGKNGVGELMNSECTPRGWHKIHSIIGTECAENSVFVARKWTGEVYSSSLALSYPNRDWILTRILRLEGLEPGRNQGGNVDSFNRYIYIHGTPDTTILGVPGSRGCIRMRNSEIIELAKSVTTGTLVYIS